MIFKATLYILVTPQVTPAEFSVIQLVINQTIKPTNRFRLRGEARLCGSVAILARMTAQVTPMFDVSITGASTGPVTTQE